ncbi:hypothetical protein GTW78_24130 [Streptomyces sp. SID4948]|nr:hypothetical protein [Streptomyces sp. SID4948]
MAAWFAAAGWTTGPLFSALLAARERYAPRDLRTQVFTLGAGLKSTAAAAGAAAAGAAAHLGPAVLLCTVGGLQLAGAAAGACLLAGQAPARGNPATPLTPPATTPPIGQNKR